MNKPIVLILLSLLIFACSQPDKPVKKKVKTLDDFFEPNDHAMILRSWPDQTPDTRAILESYRRESAASFRVSANFSFQIPWTLEGPGNIGGRFNCIRVHPTNPLIMYAGSASGGVWKTIDGGLNWTAIFENASYLAISDIQFEPGNPATLYVATGDKNISGYPFVGDGLYKSTDSGLTWTNIGLSNTGIIAKILINPQNTQEILAATMGYPFYKDNNRGMYKSSNGGATWTKVLFVNDSTGIIDAVMDPYNPQVIYAASWNRIRNNQSSLVSGPDAKVWKSINGGLTWSQLGGGLPQGNNSRIGLCISSSTPNTVWAAYVDDGLELSGIFKTVNGGSTWSALPIGPLIGSMGGFGWYFGRIEVHPQNDNILFVCGVDLWSTSDGGQTWNSAWSAGANIHADKHDLAYVSGNTWLCATDGGLYRSPDGGVSWNDIENIPNNQFYRITWSPHQPGTYAGGVQDNGSNVGNAASLNNWFQFYFADGFQVRYHPTDNQIVYAETQNGGIVVSNDGGFNFNSATNGIDNSDRRNWDMPYVMNPQNPDELLTGTYRSYLSTSGINTNWIPSGQDLTDGVIFGDRFHTISALDWSALNQNHLLCGTTDGNVWFSPDKSATWTNITSGLPDRYITSVHFSPNTAGTVYATVSGYKYGELIPHVWRSLSNGAAWVNISGNLPQWSVNDLVVYPGSDSILFAATDGGVYGTKDAGQTWARVGSNLPMVPVYDLDFDQADRKLLAGTFGRSLYSVSMDSLLLTTGLNDLSLESRAVFYPSLVNEVLYADLPAEGSLSVYDVSGKKWLEGLTLVPGRNRIVLPDNFSGYGIARIEGKGWKKNFKFLRIR